MAEAYTGFRIRTGQFIGGIFDPDEVNLRKSGEKLKALTEASIRESFPGAEVEVFVKEGLEPDGSFPDIETTALDDLGYQDETVEKEVGKICAYHYDRISDWVVMAAEA